MRLYRIWPLDVEAAVARPTLEDADEDGNRRLTGLDHSGRAIIVVIAGDDPDYVITTFPDD
jgi:hypothetical protein